MTKNIQFSCLMRLHLTTDMTLTRTSVSTSENWTNKWFLPGVNTIMILETPLLRTPVRASLIWTFVGLLACMDSHMGHQVALLARPVVTSFHGTRVGFLPTMNSLMTFETIPLGGGIGAIRVTADVSHVLPPGRRRGPANTFHHR